MDSEEKLLKDELSSTIQLSERVLLAVDDAASFKGECFDVAKLVNRLSHALRKLVRFATAVRSLYERPIRRVIAAVSNNLESALSLVRKCRSRNVVLRVVTIVSGSDFKRLIVLLESSVGDMIWLLSVFDIENATGGAGAGAFGVFSLPPIATNDPILALVWSCIVSLQMAQLAVRIEAASQLGSVASDNDRNKHIIFDEGGVPPLLKLLEEGTSPDAQIAAASALYILANDQEIVRKIVNELGVQIMVQVLENSPMKVQSQVASLVARMAEYDPLAQEQFARENLIRLLVSLLLFETFGNDHNAQLGNQSIHSIVEINKEKEAFSQPSEGPHASSSARASYWYNYYHSFDGGKHRREREQEKPEVKLSLKISCAEALWKLAKGSLSNSRRICETKGLLCLAKLVEKEEGELQQHCLMTIVEIAAAAESNADLRRAAFKPNSPAAKAIVNQLLRVIGELNSPFLLCLAIKSIGSLARTFPARETRVIGSLVTQLGHGNLDVAVEAAISLEKFACPGNFLRMEHSKTIIEFNGVPHLMRMLRGNEMTKLHGLILLCYLALHAENGEALEEAGVLTVLKGADRTHVVAHNPELRFLVPEAIPLLTRYRKGLHSQRLPFLP